MSMTPPNPATAFFAEARRSFHAALLEKVLRANDEGIPSNADGNNGASVALAKGILPAWVQKQLAHVLPGRCRATSSKPSRANSSAAHSRA